MGVGPSQQAQPDLLAMLSLVLPGYALLLLVCCAQAYPGGAPSCSARPGHGRNKGSVAALVENIGNNTWQVTMTDKHKGLVLNTKCKGTWDSAMEGYKNKGTCVTHNSRAAKDTNSFIFRAKEENKPHFSGFVVFDYSSYGTLKFLTIPVPDEVEELEVNIL